MSTPQEIARSYGLPEDAPMNAIGAYLSAVQTISTKTKDNTAQKEKKKAEQLVISYMKKKGLTFLKIGDNYLSINQSTKIDGWTDELIAEAFVAFFQGNPRLLEFLQANPALGSLEHLSAKFVNFGKQIRQGSASVHDSLKLSKKAPQKAIIQEMLQNMGSM